MLDKRERETERALCDDRREVVKVSQGGALTCRDTVACSAAVSGGIPKWMTYLPASVKSSRPKPRKFLSMSASVPVEGGACGCGVRAGPIREHQECGSSCTDQVSVLGFHILLGFELGSEESHQLCQDLRPSSMELRFGSPDLGYYKPYIAAPPCSSFSSNSQARKEPVMDANWRLPWYRS